MANMLRDGPWLALDIPRREPLVLRLMDANGNGVYQAKTTLPDGTLLTVSYTENKTARKAPCYRLEAESGSGAPLSLESPDKTLFRAALSRILPMFRVDPARDFQPLLLGKKSAETLSYLMDLPEGNRAPCRLWGYPAMASLLPDGSVQFLGIPGENRTASAARDRLKAVEIDAHVEREADCMWYFVAMASQQALFTDLVRTGALAPSWEEDPHRCPGCGAVAHDGSGQTERVVCPRCGRILSARFREKDGTRVLDRLSIG